MQRLAGRVALVTGGGRGLGRAISEAFGREGAAVGVLDLKPEVAEPAAEAIRAAGGKAVAITGNVAKRQDLFDAVAKLKAEFGPVDILVNNAMWNRYGPLEEQTEEMIGRMIDVGFKGVVWGYQAVLEDMTAAGGGAIINIGSPSSVLAMKNGIMYSAIKAAVSGLTRSGAAEFGPAISASTRLPRARHRQRVRTWWSAKRPGSAAASAFRSAASAPGRYRQRRRFSGKRRVQFHHRRRVVRRWRHYIRIFMTALCG